MALLRNGRKSQVHLQTPASMTRRANFSNIFAPKSLASLLDLDVAVEVQPEKSLLKRLDEVTPRSAFAGPLRVCADRES